MQQPLQLADYLRISEMNLAERATAIERLTEMKTLLLNARMGCADPFYSSALNNHAAQIEQMLLVIKAYR